MTLRTLGHRRDGERRGGRRRRRRSGRAGAERHYVVDEDHRLLTYRVPSNAKVTVLATSPESTPITVAELARIVAGDHKPLWEPIETGFWLRARIDTVRSLDQQYRP